MVLFTPKHDLISSHYTPPVLLTLFLEHSLHHISFSLSLPTALSPLQGCSMEFSKQKAAIYVIGYLIKELRTQRGHRSGKIPANTEAHTNIH